jgi:group I intron endonuclease
MDTYKATNTLNGKFYIGSAVNFEERKKEHLNSSLNYPFQNALRANPNAFEWEVWSDTSKDRELEQALLDMWFGSEQCYNLSPFANRPNASLEDCSKGGISSRDSKSGVHKATREELSEWGKKGGSNSLSGVLSYKNSTGIFGITAEEKNTAIKKGGQTSFEKAVGVFAPENKGKGAKTTNSTFWEDPKHPELGVLQAGPLASRQKKLGLPHGPENRRRVKPLKK